MSDGLVKIFRFEERFPTTGEPTIQLLTRRDLANVKLASEAGDYIKAVQPVPGKTIVLVLAMSAGEYYGPNRNGDAFAERAIPGVVEENETLPKHYRTFETNAHVFRHHINKDPTKSFGKVLKAFYNYEMHRVELLLELDNDLGHDVVEKINAGQYPAVSMGCKIKYDVCSICGNKAPTRAQYCDHAKYEMNRVYPDGSKSFVWNPSPQLFDISFVIRPADRIGFMMKKVAHAEPLELSADLGAKVADAQEKLSTLKKLSDIDKIIRGQTVDSNPHNRAVQSFCRCSLPGLMQNTPPLDNEAIGELSQHSLPESLSTLGSMGITPTAGEVTKMMVNRALPGQELPAGVEDHIAAAQGAILDLMQQHPEVLDAVQSTGLLDVGQDKVDPGLAQKLSAWQEKRSNFKEYVERRVFQEPHPDIGNWDPAEVEVGGKKYQTTRGAIDKADDARINHEVKTLVGLGLLTGVGYKALSAHKGGRMFAPLALAAGGVGTLTAHKRNKIPGLGFQTATGDHSVADKVTGEKWTNQAPISTELKQASMNQTLSIAAPLASSAAVTAMLAQEYNRRRDDGTLGTRPGTLNSTVEGLGQVASNHPAGMFLGGLGGIGLGAHLIGNAGKFLKHAEDSVKLAEVDLQGLAHWLGEELFRFGK